VKQFSLFISHEAPVETSVASAVIETPKPKISIESEAAKKILDIRKLNKKEKKTSTVKESAFVLDKCRFCNNVRLERYGNVYLCRHCGSENTEHGILFGEKIKRSNAL